MMVVLGLVGVGVYDLTRLPIDAVPDITNVQVQINTSAGALPPEEVERRVTFPIEWSMGGLPRVQQVRSLSRYGLSQVTLIFEDGTDVYWARQLVAERLATAKESLPSGVEEPQMGPIATGLGEIFMWSVEAEPDARRSDGQPYDLTDLRTLQDWVVRPQIRTVAGVNEVNSIGGYERIYQVAPDVSALVGFGLGFRDLVEALVRNNANAGGGFIEPSGEQLLIRAEGLVKDERDIEAIIIGYHDGTPIRVADVAAVVPGEALRTGAATKNGEEAVIGTAIMLQGENSRVVSQRVAERMKAVNASLPPGVKARTIYDRTYLVNATLSTVAKNLLEGAGLVVLVLVLLLGNLRAALIAAAVIPITMLVTVSGMNHLGVSGNLMSLGALDFGLIVDGSIIIVENCVRRFAEEQERLGRKLSFRERLSMVYDASREVRKATIFGEAIIAIVYLPILTLTGIEGKMFRPMAQTVVIALAVATVLSMTLIPALVAIVMRGWVVEREAFVLRWARGSYTRVVSWALRRRELVLLGALTIVGASVVLASTLGSEFAPKLSEGALALQPARIPSTGITASVEMQKRLERSIVAAFPDEVETVFARTGTAEVATDPMGPNVSDTYLMLRPRDQWTQAESQEELAEAIDQVVEAHIGQRYEFSQPIELRFNELISGVRSEIAVKVFGDELPVMLARANDIAAVLRTVPGAEDVRVEQVSGLPVLTIDIDRRAISRYGLNVEDVHTVVESAMGGLEAGEVYRGDQRFGLVVRLPEAVRRDVDAIRNLPIPLPEGATVAGEEAATAYVPLASVAEIRVEEGPNRISREDGKRRVVVQCNVRGRDLGTFVAEAQRRTTAEVDLPSGYWLAWGGQFENLIRARRRLAVVVPLALLLIMTLLFISFGSLRNAFLIFTGVPLALTGGVVALWLRGLPFTIAAAVGFIALSGVAVLNGLVMVTFIENLRRDGMRLERAVQSGSVRRLRPVLMTALVASLGFLPMALATGTGADVQRPLATVVIGGIVSSTLLTLLVLPVLYRLAHREGDLPREDDPHTERASLSWRPPPA